MFTSKPRQAPAVLVAIRIMRFDDIVSALGNGLLKFVRRVSEIVQGIADEFNVTTSRTNGESYLFVWDMSKYSQQVRHLAVAACVKILIAIDRDPAMREYRSHPPLGLRVPNFRVQLSMAVHEGCVFDDLLARSGGTNFELFHLLPDVHVVSEVAHLTKTYNCTGVFATKPFLSGCSYQISSLFRQLDSVHLRSSTSLIDVFCLETDPNCFIDPVDLSTVNPRDLGEHLHRDKLFRKSNKWTCDVFSLIVSDPHFAQLVGPLSSNTVVAEKFKRGFLEYQAGEWALARTALEEVQKIFLSQKFPHGPSGFLMKVMSDFNFVPPKGWTGSHVVLQ